MTTTEWAQREVELACKKENPNWDGKSFDYGCSCYQSALKAFKSLMDDGHSGFSFNMTRQILNHLMEHKPLTPITDADFENAVYSEKPHGGISKQCPRMGSFFKDIDPDGTVKYHDIDRAYCIDVNNKYNTFHSKLLCSIIDEMFPITMPYIPESGDYKIYVDEFLLDAKNGDFDHQRIHYIVTPSGEKIPVQGWCFREVDNKMVRYTDDEYEKDYKLYQNKNNAEH